jgi:hypothetical protein
MKDITSYTAASRPLVHFLNWTYFLFKIHFNIVLKSVKYYAICTLFRLVSFKVLTVLIFMVAAVFGFMDGHWYFGATLLGSILHLERKCGRLALWPRAHVYNNVLIHIQWDGYLGMFSCCLDCLIGLGICSIEAACSGFRYFVKNCNTYSAYVIFWFLRSVFVLLSFFMQPVTFCAVWYSWL